MSLRIVDRPATGKTHFIEFSFHECATVKELENIIHPYTLDSEIDNDRFFTVMRGIDPKTFEPLIYMAVKDDNKSFSEWVKFIVKMSLFNGSDYDLASKLVYKSKKP